MKVNLYVIRAVMEDQIYCHMKSPHIVTVKYGHDINSLPQIFENVLNPC